MSRITIRSALAGLAKLGAVFFAAPRIASTMHEPPRQDSHEWTTITIDRSGNMMHEGEVVATGVFLSPTIDEPEEDREHSTMNAGIGESDA